MARLNRVSVVVLVAVFALLASGTDRVGIGDLGRGDGPGGRLLLWYTWSGAEVQTLDEMIAAYVELNPNVKVVTTANGEDDISGRSPTAVPAALGPICAWLIRGSCTS